jgi:glycosyltransferase involved in cell wall biosynthesis
LFECAASKLPFLSTDVGNSAEIASWTKGGEIMPTIKDDKGFSHADINASAKALNELYSNHSKRKTMAEDSFKIWQEKYSWEVIAKDYETMYLNLLK